MSQAVVLPKMGLTMEEATLVKWHKQQGDYVKKDETILEIETDKSTLEIEAPASGYLLNCLYSEGDVIPVFETICYLNDSKNEQVIKENIIDTKATATTMNTIAYKENTCIEKPQTKVEKGIILSPAARKKARELGLSNEEIQSIVGSGPRNRIVLKDLITFHLNKGHKSIDTQEKNFSSRILETNETIMLNRVREMTAKKLTASFRDVPQFMITKSIDLTNVIKIKNTLKSVGIKVSINDFLILASASALEKHEVVNSYFIESNKESKLIKNKNINIGLAVGSDHGLVVPVIKNANQSSLVEIAKVREELILKARTNQLTYEEMNDGTFTISNLGAYDVDEFNAILNTPESAILAVSSTVKRPIITTDNKIEIRPIMNITATFDHRTVDGLDAAKFLKDLAEILQGENWKVV